MFHLALLLSLTPSDAPSSPGLLEDRELIALRPVTLDSRPRRGNKYVQIGLGLTTTTDSEGQGEEVDFDEGFALPVALGWRFNESVDGDPAWDVELEGTYADQDVSNSGPTQAVRDVTVGAVHLNLGTEVPIAGNLALTAAGGLGLAWLSIGTRDDGISSFNSEDGPFLSWQAKLGLRLNPTDSFAMGVGYRFMNIDEITIDDDSNSSEFELETEMHILEVYARFYL